MFQVSGKSLANKDLGSLSDPYFSLERVYANDGDKLVYKSEKVDNDLNPKWPEVKLERVTLDSKEPLVLSVFDFEYTKKHELIGSVTLTLEDMRSGCKGRQEFELINEEEKAEDEDYVNGGKIVFRKVEFD